MAWSTESLPSAKGSGRPVCALMWATKKWIDAQQKEFLNFRKKSSCRGGRLYIRNCFQQGKGCCVVAAISIQIKELGNKLKNPEDSSKLYKLGRGMLGGDLMNDAIDLEGGNAI